MSASTLLAMPMTSPLSSETRRTWPPDCRRHPLVFGRLCKRGDAHSGTRWNNDASQASDCDSDRRRHLEDILQQEKETQTHASIRSNSATISRARQVSSKCDHQDRRSTKRKTTTNQVAWMRTEGPNSTVSFVKWKGRIDHSHRAGS